MKKLEGNKQDENKTSELPSHEVNNNEFVIHEETTNELPAEDDKGDGYTYGDARNVSR